MSKRIIMKVISGIVLCSMFAYVSPVFAYNKEEIVYSKAKPNGDVYKTIVTEHINNSNKESIIKDLSNLINIENTKGEETYNKNGEIIEWNANGNDIYYQGETSKPLPIKCEIKYELDGQTKTIDEIKGKSG